MAEDNASRICKNCHNHRLFTHIPPSSPVEIINDSIPMLLDFSKAEPIASDSTTLLPGSSTQSASKQQPAKEIQATSTQQTKLLDKILVPSISKPTASTHAITKARILTSTEYLNIIRAKEMKKKVEEEEKQKRKKEREEKRKKVQEEKEKSTGRKGKKSTRKGKKVG